ncbi:MAG: NAD-binding protein [Polyangiaceae bacterium]
MNVSNDAGHYVVIGLGHIGSRVVSLLHKLGRRVVVITDSTKELWLRAARDAGAQVILGDARNDERLHEAGLDSAAALLVLTDSDLTNLEIVLDARKMRADLPIVARIFDQTLARHLEDALDLRRALAVSAIAAPAFAAGALGEQIAGAFQLEHQVMLLGRLTINGSSKLIGCTPATASKEHGLELLDAHLRDEHSRNTALGENSLITGVAERDDWLQLLAKHAEKEENATRKNSLWMALGLIGQSWTNAPPALRVLTSALATLIALSVLVFRFGMDLSLIDAIYFIITTVTTTGYGDITPKDSGTALKLYACILMMLGSASTAVLYSFVTDFVIAERFKAVLGKQKKPARHHTILVGLGNLGMRVATELQRAHAAHLVIERDPNDDFIEAIRTETAVINGDGRLVATLREAGIDKASAIIAATGDDAVNLGVALEARRHNPKLRTIVRLFDADLARKVQEGMRIDAALSASAIAAPVFVAAALHPHVVAATVIGDDLLTLCVHEPKQEWIGKTPAEVRASTGIDIVMRRGVTSDSFGRPAPNVPLTGGERLLVAMRDRLVGCAPP